MAAMHKATCTRPGCGLACSSPSVDEVMAWSDAHDQHCPSLQAQEIAPRLLAEAEKRGGILAVRKILDDIDEDRTYPGLGIVFSLTALLNNIESGEVTL